MNESEPQESDEIIKDVKIWTKILLIGYSAVTLQTLSGFAPKQVNIESLTTEAK